MSAIEYELRILEVDPASINKKIISIGGELVGSYSFRRYVFNVKPPVKGRWIRLRTNGQHSTLTVKQIDADTVDGTSEWETSVDNFDTTLTILEKIGLKPKSYQENRREEYRLGDVTLALDSWPLIPPYLEIEGPNEASVVAAAKKLGYQESDLVGENTQKIYSNYGIDIDSIPVLKFDA